MSEDMIAIIVAAREVGSVKRDVECVICDESGWQFVLEKRRGIFSWKIFGGATTDRYEIRTRSTR